MMRLTFATSVLVVLEAAVLAASSDDTTPTIEQIMDKLHKGGSSPLAKLKIGASCKACHAAHKAD